VGTLSSIYVASPLLLIFGEGRHHGPGHEPAPVPAPQPA
jgi:preprotein translocase subunit SecF